MPDRITLGFTIIGDGVWRGGINYQRTLLEIIATRLPGRVTARLFLAPGQEDLAQKEFAALLEAPPIVDARVAGAGRGKRALTALASGRDAGFAALLGEHGVDVGFENARFYGAGFPIPLLAWMPDFQHRHLPHLFSRPAWWRREAGFRAQTLGRRILLLSSHSAEADALSFYPRANGRIRVARFCGRMDIAGAVRRAELARADHGLPKRFFYLPNQFWVHKNHAVVLEALTLLRREGEAVPPVIMSGTTEDHRDPGFFARLMDRAAAAGLAEQFRHLGLIPYADVLALNAAADAVVNPSLFEGWASSVEEAKSLGTPLVLSDLPVHREQAPEAAFFRPDDAAGLAAHLSRIARAEPRRRVPEPELEAANAARIAAFAQDFLSAVEAAAALGRG